MPDLPDQHDEPFVVEPLQHVDGSPVPPTRRQSVARWLWRLVTPGQIALAEGAALLGLFWFAPWLSWRNLGFGFLGDHHNTPAYQRYLHSLLVGHNSSGLAVAQGVVASDAPFAPLALWLIPLIALALLVLAGLGLQHRLSARFTRQALLALSVLALIVEAGFYIQTQRLQITLGGLTEVDVSWGFWSAVGVNAAVLIAGIALPLHAGPRARPHATGAHQPAIG